MLVNKLFERYPCLILFLCFAMGVVIAQNIDIPIAVWLVLFCVLSFLVVQFGWLICFGLWILVLGIIRFDGQTVELNKDNFYGQSSSNMVSPIQDIWPHTRYFLAQENDQKIAILTQAPITTFIARNSKIQITGDQWSLEQAKFLSSEFKTYLKSQKIQKVYHNVHDVMMVTPSKDTSLFSKLRLYFLKNLYGGVLLHSENVDVIAGMVLGKPVLSRELVQSLLRTNTIHILVISGSQMAIIYGLIACLLGIFKIHYKWITFLSLVFVWIYTFLVEASVPVLRAAIMITIYLIAKLLNRKPDSLNSLGLAGLVMLVIHPAQLFDAGFQLSFLSVLGLIHFDLFQWKETNNIWRSTCLGSLACWVWLWPIISYYFKLISPLGLIANLWAVLFVTFFVINGILSMLLGSIVPIFSHLINVANVHLVDYFVQGIQQMEQWFTFLVWSIQMPLWFCLIYYSILGALFLMATSVKSSFWAVAPTKR